MCTGRLGTGDVMEPKAGYVYLLQAGDMYRFKIGCASDLHKRLISLRTASPVQLHLLGAIKTTDMYAEEGKWHRLFASSRAIGEWFDLDEKQFLGVARKFRAKYVIRPRDRSLDDLRIEGTYYISLDGRKAIEVQLVELEFFHDPNRHDHAKVKEVNGWQSWNVFPDEVRTTQIGALFNCMFLHSPLVREIS